MALVARWLALAMTLTPAAALAAGVSPGARLEITHSGQGHEVHLSAPAVAVGRDGRILVAWIAQNGHAHDVYLARPEVAGARPVRVNPEELSAESLHQAPGIATGPRGEIYVSWSSAKAKPEGVLFASDLQLSRSLDGGQSFERALRVNDDRPLSHSFDGLAAGADGTVYLAWIDAREGSRQPRTYLARIGEQGTGVEHVARLDAGETCVCCRVAVAAGPGIVAALWRKVFPGDVRDMVLGLSRDGGRSFGPPALVHADGWKLTACPHRGGQVAIDSRGRLHAAWYTEGGDDTPRILFASAADGRRFDKPRAIAVAAGSVPDHVRLALARDDAVAVVWEDATAVRRRVRIRASLDGGRTFAAAEALSTAVKAYAPDVAAAPGGDIIAVWHEERFPSTATVVQRLTLRRPR